MDSDSGILKPEPTHHCHEHHPHGELHRSLDKVGAFASLFCAVHCALMPVLVVLIPTTSVLVFAENHTLENVFIAFSAVLATTSLSLGYRHHGRRDIFLLLGLSLFTLLSSRFFHPSSLELVLLVGGALGITTCHILNRRWCYGVAHQ